MTKGKRKVLTVVCLTILFSGVLPALVSIPGPVAAYTLHAPIRINGDGDFTAANGVTGGSGSWNDPFVIEGWEINASTAHGIELLNTTAHFLIKDSFIHSGTFYFQAI